MSRTPPFQEIIARSPRVFVIGVAGDSGSGKTTFTNAIRQIFGPDLVATITLDDYHRYDREERKKLDITPLHPDANNLAGLETDVARLKEGYAIQKPVYNHTTGTFDPPVPFASHKIIILEGLHTLFTPKLRELINFSVFVDPDPEVKYAWKRRRDIERRGYSSDQVSGEIERRKKDYEEFIAPQRCLADAVIRIMQSRYSDDSDQEKNMYRISLLQRKVDHMVGDMSLAIDLHAILSFDDHDFLIEFSTENVACARMRALTFDGKMNYTTVRKLEKSIEQQTGVHPIAIFENRATVTATDLVQLILSWRIIHRRIFLQAQS
ncbi:MAG: phosphoribulokinase [Methanoregula sp.]|jgi:phosphoribulokinase